MIRRSLLVLLPLLLSGCVALVQRSPNTGLVQELGSTAAAQKELKIVSTRARDPQIVDVDFNDVGFVYVYNSLAPMTLIPIQGRNSVVYNNLSRLDLYENNRVFIITSGDREQGAITFSNMSDAERWVDLVLSLKADYLQNQ